MDANVALPRSSTRSSTRLFTPNKNKKKRIRVFTPDDRATHRVIEKQRREALNERFIELARLLPGLASHHRLSKSIIVHESIAHHKKQRAAQLTAAREIRCLLSEREELLAEVNDWRTRFSHVGTELRQGRQLDEDALDLLNVENEEFGKFPHGFGDNRPSDEEADAYQDVGENAGEPSLAEITEVQPGSSGQAQSLSARFDAVTLPPDDANVPSRIEDPFPGPAFPLPHSSGQRPSIQPPHQMDAGVPGCLLSSFVSEEQPALHQAAVPLGTDDLWELLGPNPQLDVNPDLAEPRATHDETLNSTGVTGQFYL